MEAVQNLCMHSGWPHGGKGWGHLGKKLGLCFGCFEELTPPICSPAKVGHFIQLPGGSLPPLTFTGSSDCTHLTKQSSVCVVSTQPFLAESNGFI